MLEYVRVCGHQTNKKIPGKTSQRKKPRVLKVPGNAEKLRVKSFESEQIRGKSKKNKHVSTQ